ncbi:hypothetical protein L873DRAFT_899437 [Choiromyces venosus 120613-1]|uniref:Uncharacterized protein n=1 Tax=Choiromyces venosus 120613-1 TaxID=1336337 RepID=A0A3N4JN99_9PEZI|nr:hypothetical protein L873DRAFT_899437 [Choiromyces venosus 120613-1]
MSVGRNMVVVFSILLALECGKPYGGCFLDPACTGGYAWPTFTKPPCPTTTTCSRTICADYVNECGKPYGGCFLDPACTGGTAFPTFTKPPCPTTTTGSTTTTCSKSVCVDNVDECGQMYGGCFLDPTCTGGSKWPTFTKPPCNSTTTGRSTTTSASTTCKRAICADYVNECGQMYGGCFLDPVCTGGTAWPTFSKPPCPTTRCSRSICYDGIDKCGQFYGGCTLVPECGGPKTPTFSRLPCPPTTTTTSTTTTATSTCTVSLCVDGIDACGQGWGGCFLAPECGGKEPSWTKPPCTKPTVTPTVTKYTTICPPGQAVTKFVTRTLTYTYGPVKSYYVDPTVLSSYTSISYYGPGPSSLSSSINPYIPSVTLSSSSYVPTGTGRCIAAPSAGLDTTLDFDDLYGGISFTPRPPYKGFNFSRSTNPAAPLSIGKTRNSQFSMEGTITGIGSYPAWLFVHRATRQMNYPPSLDIIAMSQDSDPRNCAFDLHSFYVKPTFDWFNNSRINITAYDLDGRFIKTETRNAAGGLKFDVKGQGFEGIGLLTILDLTNEGFFIDDVKVTSRCCAFPKRPATCPKEDYGDWKVFIQDFAKVPGNHSLPYQISPGEPYGYLYFRTHFDLPTLSTISDPVLGTSTMLHTTPDVLNITLSTKCDFWLGAFSISPDEPAAGGNIIVEGYDFHNELAWTHTEAVYAAGGSRIDMIWSAYPSVWGVRIKIVVQEANRTRLMGFAIDDIVLSGKVE